MPIHCPITLRDLSKSEFDERDALVMRCAYASQNTLGRLHDEQVYENDIALRLRAEGCEVHTQVPVTVTFNTFEKTYRCDLIVQDALYELKTVSALTTEQPAFEGHLRRLMQFTGSRGVQWINFHHNRVQFITQE